VAFNGLGRITPTPAGTITYDISNPTGGTCLAAGGKMRCLRLEVSASGQVRMCDPNLPAATASNPDPQGC
jgi:type IV fimbrial biogenesis protein FimT